MSIATHRARKRFGQHFLHDQTIIARIIRAIAPQPGQRLVEIGPGLGAITQPLLALVQQLDVIELDRDLIPHLQQTCQPLGQLRVHQEDALRFDFAALRGQQEPLRVVGNLPYNIATALIFYLLQQAEHVLDMHFMLQQEVVERLAASPGRPGYGRLSVMVQYHCQVQSLFKVAAGAFSPPPKVVSAVVRLLPYAQRPVLVDCETTFAVIVKQAFSQRRKTLRNSLRSLLPEQAMRDLDIDPSARPETLSLAQFAALSDALTARNNDV